MKRLFVLFIVSILGIILVQLLGSYAFGYLQESYHSLAATFALVLKFLFYLILIYVTVKCVKLNKTSLGFKLFKFVNIFITAFLTLMFVIYSVAMLLVMIESRMYFNKKHLDEIPKTAIKTPVNPLVDYNNTPVTFIQGIRLGNIDENFAKLVNYEPREDIWGKADDSANWIAFNRTVCFDKNTDCARKVKGLSAASRIINNPMLLVAPMLIGTYNINESFPICSDTGMQLIPQSIYLDVLNSKIIVTYKGTAVLTKCKFLQLTGFNARDFGLEWGFVNKSQNILFPYKDNVSKKIFKFQDEIVVSKCSENSDKKCNIIAPIDDKLVFNITSFPANIEIKLWKNKPIHKSINPKFNMEIRFVE